MLIFGVAQSNFAMEWGLGFTIKCWVKEAKCQGVVGGFMVIQMEMEEFHVLLSLTFLCLDYWFSTEETSSPCPQIDHVHLHKTMGTERETAGFFGHRKAWKGAKELESQLRRASASWACCFCCWVTVGKMHFLPQKPTPLTSPLPPGQQWCLSWAWSYGLFSKLVFSPARTGK